MKIAANSEGTTLRVDDAISPKLLHASADIQAVINAWYPKFHKVQVIAKERKKDLTSRGNLETASFFSGGVDSFYTMLKHDSEYKKIFYVHGFDLYLSMEDSLKETSERLQRAAKDFNKELVEVSTNIHDFSEEFAYWPDHYHGSAMASMAMMFSKRIDKFYFASTHSYADMFPWGSHPVLNPLWSTEYMAIVHDGAEVNRVQKTEYIVKRDERVLKYLNVGCHPQCKRGEKCLRTMIALDMLGVLDKAETFYHPLETKDIASIYINDASAYAFVLENFFALAGRPDKIEVRKALRIPIEDYKNRIIANRLNNNIKSFCLSKHSEPFREELYEVLTAQRQL